jgi:hypothetical protein
MSEQETPVGGDSLPPAPRMDPFTARRIRSSVMAGHMPDKRNHRKRLLASMVAIAAIASIVGIAWVMHSRWERPWFEITAAPSAVMRESDEPGTHFVAIDDGSVAVEVHSHPNGVRLVVRVPDGEIEDLGTRFSVLVAADRTERIDVSVGRVIFRRRGQLPVVVEPGSSFVRAPDVEPPASSVAIISTSSVASAVVAESTASGPPSSRQSKDLGPKHPSAEHPSPSASTTSPVGEDDAYLHVLALLRGGDREGARTAARAYLQRYPNGFRREEMERVAGD